MENNVDKIEVVQDVDDIDEDYKSSKTEDKNVKTESTDNIQELPEIPGMDNLNDMDFTKMLEAMKSMDPKTMNKLMSKLGISNTGQLNQLQNMFGGLHNNKSSEPPTRDELRQRLREKRDMSRLKRSNKSVKNSYIERETEKVKEKDLSNNEVTHQENLNSEKSEAETKSKKKTIKKRKH